MLCRLCAPVLSVAASRVNVAISHVWCPCGFGEAALKKAAWKYALHKVSSGLSLIPSPDGDTKRPMTLGLGELASAFAVLDVLEVSDEEPITPSAFLSAIDRQRSLVLSLISNAGVTSAASGAMG